MNHTKARSFIAYLRVSTVRQGQTGVSLIEQRRAIEEFARNHDLTIISWQTEMQTAARVGRSVFRHVIRELKRGNGVGLLLHRIDRGARNLWDWAELGQLIDQGVDIRFVHDDLDLHSRGGRLAADIQAVIAADYVRNLRDETIKGMRGRFRQGLYPLAAPLGYLNRGGGKPKTPDPAGASHVAALFQLYASGRHTFDTLRIEFIRRGLRTRTGRLVSRSMFSRILSNRFYVGEVHLRRTGEIFPGVHEPLISVRIFNDVQHVLRGRRHHRRFRHRHRWSGRLMCSSCKHFLVGETQKGHVYYRCHTRGCPTKCVREEVVDARFVSTTVPLRLDSNDEIRTEQDSQGGAPQAV